MSYSHETYSIETKVLTRLLLVRWCPSSLYPDLSSFLLPLGRKHNIWIGFGIGLGWNLSAMNRSKSWEEHDWFTDKREKEQTINPQRKKGVERGVGGRN